MAGCLKRAATGELRQTMADVVTQENCSRRKLRGKQPDKIKNYPAMRSFEFRPEVCQ